MYFIICNGARQAPAPALFSDGVKSVIHSILPQFTNNDDDLQHATFSVIHCQVLLKISYNNTNNINQLCHAT